MFIECSIIFLTYAVPLGLIKNMIRNKLLRGELTKDGFANDSKGEVQFPCAFHLVRQY